MIFLTPEGKEKLEHELSKLIARRPEVSQRIERAKELGDLKENAEYHDAKDEQGMMEARIREIQATLSQAQVVEKQSTGGIVNMGSKILVVANEKEREYEIVGANEANPAIGKISNDSPLAKALLSRKEGDSVEVNAPAGKIIYIIKEVK